MADEADERKAEPHDRARRELLKRFGMVGAASVVPGGAFVQTASSFAAEARVAAAPPREALETLTAAESDTLEAIVARLIPSDANGPGAAEARAAHYIDRALAGPLASARKAYGAGLAALNTYAQTTKGEPFARLQAKDQDAVLSEMEKNAAMGFTPNSSTFFNLLRAHTIQGTFCDPYYGGNANFVGWDLIRYPGLRLVVTADEQRMNVRAKPVRQSAYADATFTMKGGSHGHRP